MHEQDDNGTVGKSCFEWNGDDQWFIDTNSDGWGVASRIQTEYGKERYCRNFHGIGRWHECRYDHREWQCIRWKLGEVKIIDGRYYYRNWSYWTFWYNTSTGERESLCD